MVREDSSSSGGGCQSQHRQQQKKKWTHHPNCHYWSNQLMPSGPHNKSVVARSESVGLNQMTSPQLHGSNRDYQDHCSVTVSAVTAGESHDSCSSTPVPVHKKYRVESPVLVCQGSVTQGLLQPSVSSMEERQAMLASYAPSISSFDSNTRFCSRGTQSDISSVGQVGQHYAEMVFQCSASEAGTSADLSKVERSTLGVSDSDCTTIAPCPRSTFYPMEKSNPLIQPQWWV